MVASLDFHHGVLPEVWRTCLTPQDLRTEDGSNVSGLILAAVSNFKLLRDQFYARKRKERAIYSTLASYCTTGIKSQDRTCKLASRQYSVSYLQRFRLNNTSLALDILHGTYEKFCLEYGGLKIPPKISHRPDALRMVRGTRTGKSLSGPSVHRFPIDLP